MRNQRIEPWQVILVMLIGLGILFGLNSTGGITPTRSAIKSTVEKAEKSLKIATPDPYWDCDFNGKKSGFEFFLVEGGQVLKGRDTSYVIFKDEGIAYKFEKGVYERTVPLPFSLLMLNGIQINFNPHGNISCADLQAY